MTAERRGDFFSPSAFSPQRPYEIHSNNPVESLVQLFSTVSVQYSSAWSKEMVALLRKVKQPRWRGLRCTLAAARAGPAGEFSAC